MSERSVSILPGRMKLAEYERQDWVVNAEFGTNIQDVLDPAYWAHVASRFKPYDHIEVRSEDGSWIAKFLVLGCDRTWAKIHLLSEHKLTTTDISLSQAIKKHDAQWRGPEHKWSVIRLSDKEVIKVKFDSKEEANRWIVEHEKVVA